ncbi:WbqC family protein [Aliarcobacter cryaerophilus]|uniref:WbqC family protein n=1 Tax=Aliarcobacter cryaerophilus TaxID=28198 RepID=UPI000824B6C6|nr:WbqC family protein [Aliarcobacter cryaerophilus]
MKKIAILQSNYIPWKGYFDMINTVDEFIFYDEVQYTKNDWRNRNKIKTSQGIQWLTIPVRQNNINQLINETKVSDKNWGKKHWKTLIQNYSKAKYFKEYKDIFEELYLNCNEEYLSQINYKFIFAINKILEINTKLRWSNEFKLFGEKTEKIISICKNCNADIYLSGPAAKDYFNLELAKKENLKVEWMDYSKYSEYPQLFGDFEHKVTILDLIFNTGPKIKQYLKKGIS